MSGLSKAYGTKKVLENIHLSFYPDAKIGILGPNGSGKSTVLRIMTSEEHTSELQSLMRISYAVFCLKKKKNKTNQNNNKRLHKCTHLAKTRQSRIIITMYHIKQVIQMHQARITPI